MRWDLKERTKRFALDVLRVSQQLAPDSPGWLLRGQLIRAGIGVGCELPGGVSQQVRSDFIAKLLRTPNSEFPN